MKKITRFILIDLMRNRFVLAYSIFLMGTSTLLFLVEDNPAKALIGLMNLILFILPLVCLVFTTIYMYNSSEFIELLLSQPVKRKTLLLRIYLGLVFSFIGSAIFGIGLPILIFHPTLGGLTLLSTSVLLSSAFCAIALLCAVYTRDKARGIGAALLLWFFFAFVFDGLVLFALYQFADYPLEKPMIIAAMLNPIDLSRIMLLLQTDLSAMLGFTGAIFQKFFGSIGGISLTFFTLLLWIVFPVLFAIRRFIKKDL